MNKEEIEIRVRAILARLAHVEPKFDQPFKASKIDSLDLVELMIECEREFDIFIPDRELADCTTLNQMVDLIYSKKQST